MGKKGGRYVFLLIFMPTGNIKQFLKLPSFAGDPVNSQL